LGTKGLLEELYCVTIDFMIQVLEYRKDSLRNRGIQKGTQKGLVKIVYRVNKEPKKEELGEGVQKTG